MDHARTLLGRSRPAEAVFALFALFFASGLPIPPADGYTLYLAVHWYGMAAIALLLIWALRHPTRRAWVAAAALSAYFLVSAALGWRPLVEAARGRPAPAVTIAVVIFAVPVLAQAAVAVACWQSRRLAVRVPRTSDAPVA